MKKFLKSVLGLFGFVAAAATAIYAFRDKIKNCHLLTTEEGTLKEPFASIVEFVEHIFDAIVSKVNKVSDDMDDEFDDWDDEWVDDEQEQSNREYTSIKITDDDETPVADENSGLDDSSIKVTDMEDLSKIDEAPASKKGKKK